MVADAFYDEFKMCPVCEDPFFRPRTASPEAWRPRITCSRPCAREFVAARAAGRVLTAPTPGPTQPRRKAGADWRHNAACRDEDPELFFPVGTSGPAAVQIAEAKSVCHRCPVTKECLTWALDTGQEAGIWAGMTEDERRALKRRNTRTKARTS